MSSFTDPLYLEFLDDYTFRVIREFRFCIGEPTSDRCIVVPVGSLTDFASIPRILWNVFPPHGRYGKAAVIHDALYRNHGWGRYSRKESDDILTEGMKVLGVNPVTRAIIYTGVRIGGWITWRKTKVQRDAAIVNNSDISHTEVKESPEAYIKM